MKYKARKLTGGLTSIKVPEGTPVTTESECFRETQDIIEKLSKGCHLKAIIEGRR